MTMFVRFGNGRNFSGKDSQVLRPIKTVLPRVSFLKCARSSGKYQGRAPLLPMQLLAAIAAMRDKDIEKIKTLIHLLDRNFKTNPRMTGITDNFGIIVFPIEN